MTNSAAQNNLIAFYWQTSCNVKLMKVKTSEMSMISWLILQLTIRVIKDDLDVRSHDTGPRPIKQMGKEDHKMLEREV